MDGVITKLDREKLTASLGKGTGDLSFLQAIGKGAGEATGSVDQKRKQIEEQIRRIDQRTRKGLKNGKGGYIIPLVKSKHFQTIEKYWGVFIPFNKADLEVYKE